MRVFSGIQPTGLVHLGNYFGALKQWVELQNKGYECFYCIANQHALTLPQDPKKLKSDTLKLAATLIAIGIDPEKSVLFVQSDVPAHAELSWFLSCCAPLGQMERMIQFKEKAAKEPGEVTLGLLSYPVLQAADILLYNADIVPVGIDQAQHLELTRLLAQKCNALYGEIFTVPKTLHTKTTKVIGLDGSAKMSKSMDNYIGLVEEPDVILKKLRRAATDPARVKRDDPGNPFVCNIYNYHTLFSEQTDLLYVVEGCKTAKIGCLDCKQLLFDRMESFLQPIRKRYRALLEEPDSLRQHLVEGAIKAQKVAQKTLEKLYDAVGLGY